MAEETIVQPEAQTTELVATPATVTLMQTDIAKIEDHIAALRVDGKELFIDVIAELEVKRDALIAEAAAIKVG